MTSQQAIPILGIGMMLIGLFFTLRLPRKQRERNSRAFVVFVLGALILLTDYLIRSDLSLNLIRLDPQWLVVILGFVVILLLYRR